MAELPEIGRMAIVGGTAGGLPQIGVPAMVLVGSKFVLYDIRLLSSNRRNDPERRRLRSFRVETWSW